MYSADLHIISQLKDDAEKSKHTILVLEQMSTFFSLTLPETDQNVQLVRKEIIEQRKTLADTVWFTLNGVKPL